MRLKKLLGKEDLHWVALKVSVPIFAVIILAIVLMYRPPYESLEGNMIRSNTEINLSECRLETESALLDYSDGKPHYGEDGFFTRNEIEVPSANGYKVNMSMPLSTKPHEYENGQVLICNKNNCPSSYDGAFLSITHEGERSYVPLVNEDGSVVDLSKGSQHLSVDHVFSVDRSLAVSLHGVTSEIPYLIGLNGEQLIIHELHKIEDIDGDKKFDYAWNDTGLALYLSDYQEVYHFEPGEMIVGEEKLGYYNSSIVPALTGTGIYTVKAVKGEPPQLGPGDVVELFAEGDILGLRCP
ncbi:MAG: hypothetical protein ACLFP2_02755 [Candidatus Woesearchaeota archaeon]